MTLVLVGPPGSGKSTVGRLLAVAMATEFRDTDDDIAAIAGTSIGDIFIDSGEEHFRVLERRAAAAALDEHAGVLALSSGAVLDADIRQRLAAPRVVFLDVGLADAARRVGLSHDRPVMALNPRAQLHHLLTERRPLYVEVADVIISTDGRSPDDIAAEILDG